MEIIYAADSPAAQASKLVNHTRKHIFLTGKAGTGKTTFLKHILQQTHKKAVVCAPTGIAAINAGGVTIHSLFQLGFGAYVPDATFRPSIDNSSKFNTPGNVMGGFKMSEAKRKVLREMELLIIDEVSMLRADILDAIDQVCRIVRKKGMDFGGVQVLFIGDLLQLPPVIKDDEWEVLGKYYRSIYFFDALCLANNPPVYVELDKIYRQSDAVFIGILNNLRHGIVTEPDIAILNKHYYPNFKSSQENNYITLTTHNYAADSLNKTLLSALSNPSFYFEAAIEDEFGEQAYPVPRILELKLGAQIMFVKNDPKHRYFNGKIATISAISKSKIEAKLDDDPAPIEIEMHTWENSKYVLNAITNEIKPETIGTFSQYPIKLAWAITVHKSQGLTFEKAIVDIGRAFAPGQVYVALSRLKSLDGLVMSSYINKNSLTQDEKITAYSNTKEEQKNLETIIEQEMPVFFHAYLLESFDFMPLYNAAQTHQLSYTALSADKSSKQKFLPWAKEFTKSIQNMNGFAQKFMGEIHKITQNAAQGYVQHLLNRVSAAESYFVDLLEKESKTLFDLFAKVKSEKKVKGYLQELQDLELLVFKKQSEIRKAKGFCQAVLNNTEYTKAENAKVIDQNEREKTIEQANSVVLKKEKESAISPETGADYSLPKPKQKGGASAIVSFEMYKSGMSIENIATERGLVVGTVTQHLMPYIATGELSVHDLISEERLSAILAVITPENQHSRSLIKEVLPEDYSYNEIAVGLSHFHFLAKE